MPPVAPRTPTKRHFLKLLILAPLVIATDHASADPVADGDKLQKIRADCRLEGEAGGIHGVELEKFIEQCVADLLSVEIRNTGEP